MEISSQLLTFAGSLVAIIALAALARILGLGRDPVLANEAEAMRQAGEVHDGFLARTIALDSAGKGALLQDEAGAIMVLKSHGGHFAGRMLDEASTALMRDGTLIVDCGELLYGKVSLKLDDPELWARKIDGLGSRG